MEYEDDNEVKMKVGVHPCSNVIRWSGYRCLVLVLASLLAVSLPVLAADDDPDNPRPAEGDLVLPLPGGGSMVFRPVFLGVDESDIKVFAGRKFRLGDRKSGGYKESPTEVLIGGAFLAPRNGQEDWVYYIGKYEVTERQYSLVMTPESPSESIEAVSEISWLEMQTFMEKYNHWLRTTQAETLPKLDESLGFVRLPTEAEWEFAVRGGIEVDQNQFDATQPFGKMISRSEWFSGPRSSHDKRKDIGILQPNPLGMYDCLGNVSELTSSPYRIEYFQGRLGGLTAKGGNFRTPMNRLRSSMRTEIPVMMEDGTPARQSELGFRLALSSPVFAGRDTINEMEAKWAAYQKQREASSTAASVISSTTGKATYSLNDAVASLDRLETSVKAMPNASEEMLSSLGLLRAAFNDVESIIYVAERESAAAWARMASYNAYFLHQEAQKVPASERVIEISKTTGNAAQQKVYEERHQNLLNNIRDARSQYGVIMGELGKLQSETVQLGFEKYENYLIELGLTDQIRINQIVIRHYNEYADSKRLNMDQWAEELGAP